MSRRSTASSRGYVGDVSAGSVYASGTTSGGTTVRTAEGVRVPRPSGDPTGEGYAKQYAAYVAVASPEQMKGVSPPTSPTGMVEAGLSITVMPAATPPTGGTIYGKKVGGIYTTREYVTPGLYRVSGLPVSREEYYARKAGARAEAYRSGGYQLQTPYTEISYLKKKPTAEEQRLMQGTIILGEEKPKSAFTIAKESFMGAKVWAVWSGEIRKVGRYFGFEKYHARTPVGKVLKYGVESLISPEGLAKATFWTATSTVGTFVWTRYVPYALQTSKIVKVSGLGLTGVYLGVSGYEVAKQPTWEARYKVIGEKVFTEVAPIITGGILGKSAKFEDYYAYKPSKGKPKYKPFKPAQIEYKYKLEYTAKDLKGYTIEELKPSEDYYTKYVSSIYKKGKPTFELPKGKKIIILPTTTTTAVEGEQFVMQKTGTVQILKTITKQKALQLSIIKQESLQKTLSLAKKKRVSPNLLTLTLTKKQEAIQQPLIISRTMLITKELIKSKSAIKPFQKILQLPKQIVRTKTITSQVTPQMQFQLITPKTMTITPTRTVTETIIEPVKPVVWIPRFKVDVFGFKGKGGPFRPPKFKPKYTPSLMAGMFNIRGKQPKTITGLEVRPLPLLKRLRRRK